MSETGPDPVDPDPQPARWVKAKVVGEEPEPPPADTVAANTESGPVPVPDQPPVTSEEIEGARWFAIAFLVIMVPLGLIVLGLIVWGVIRSIQLE